MPAWRTSCSQTARSAVNDEVGFYLAREPAGVDEGVHHLLDALLALHQATAVDHAERLIREAGLGRRQRDAAGDHLRVGSRQTLAQLLGPCGRRRRRRRSAHAGTEADTGRAAPGWGMEGLAGVGLSKAGLGVGAMLSGQTSSSAEPWKTTSQTETSED